MAAVSVIDRRVPEPSLGSRECHVNRCQLCDGGFTRAEAREAIRKEPPEQVAALSLQRGFLEAVRFEAKAQGRPTGRTPQA